jgi:glucosamine 6-phosphate synthetase-like amidotransferase/phosphosugar isomerase protein
LELRGYTFKSDTDTEVLVNLIEEVLIHENVSIDEAVRIALNQVVGAYAIAVIEEGNHDQIVVAKKGSPLVIGIGEGEYYIASDATPFIEYTKQAVYLEEEELAILSLKGRLFNWSALFQLNTLRLILVMVIRVGLHMEFQVMKTLTRTTHNQIELP